MLHVLDCTLRDGGYYNNWDYEPALVERYLRATASAGIRHVEIGFRGVRENGFAGRFRYSRDQQLARLPRAAGTKLAVMVETKELVGAGGVDEAALDRCFAQKKDSPVDLVRIATTVDALASAGRIAQLLKDRGFEVAVNVMQASLLSEKDIAAAAEEIESSPADIVYLADSFGGLTPRDTGALFRTLRAHSGRALGFHSHDNLGLALANTLAAIEAGATYVDSSILGMGRGAGNLRTEQLLFYLSAKEGRTHLDPTPLFEVIGDFEQLHRRYGWGFNLAYLLSGVYNVHPTYAQRLLERGGRRYSPDQVVRVLESIHASGQGTSFSDANLTRSLEVRFRGIKDRVPIADLRTYRGAPPLEAFGPDQDVLIIGSGPSVRERAGDINEYVRQRSPIVLECNYHATIEDSPRQFTLFANWQRLAEALGSMPGKRARVILGFADVAEQAREPLSASDVFHVPYRVTPHLFDPAGDVPAIPHDVVAMYAFAIALRPRPRAIYLCGFDGYSTEYGSTGLDVEEHIQMDREMQEFARLLRGVSVVPVVSLTPTTYDFQQGSLYAHI